MHDVILFPRRELFILLRKFQMFSISRCFLVLKTCISYPCFKCTKILQLLSVTCEQVFKEYWGHQIISLKIPTSGLKQWPPGRTNHPDCLFQDLTCSLAPEGSPASEGLQGLILPPSHPSTQSCPILSGSSQPARQLRK